MIEVATAARELQGATAPEILRWASHHLSPRLTFATGFGAEGCVIIDLIARDELPIDLFALETELLFPETYALWRALEAKYGITIRAVRPAQTVAQQEATLGPALWARDPDRCCELRKIEPLRRALSGFDAWITAIRREQTPERAAAQVVEHDHRFDLVKINPLVTWTHDDVWTYLHHHDVPYNELHERGFPTIGCQPCTSPGGAGEHARAGRWRDALRQRRLQVLPATKEIDA